MQQLVQQFLGSKSETGQVEALGSSADREVKGPCPLVSSGSTETLCRYLPVLVTICLGDQWWEHSTWPILHRLWVCLPSKAFAFSPKYLKNFYVPNFILGRDWQCLKLHLYFPLSDSKALFLYLPKSQRIFILQNLIYCITFLLYCSSSSKSLLLYSSLDNLLCLYLSVWHLEARWLE